MGEHGNTGLVMHSQGHLSNQVLEEATSVPHGTQGVQAVLWTDGTSHFANTISTANGAMEQIHELWNSYVIKKKKKVLKRFFVPYVNPVCILSKSMSRVSLCDGDGNELTLLILGK